MRGSIVFCSELLRRACKVSCLLFLNFGLYYFVWSDKLMKMDWRFSSSSYYSLCLDGCTAPRSQLET